MVVFVNVSVSECQQYNNRCQGNISDNIFYYNNGENSLINQIIERHYAQISLISNFDFKSRKPHKPRKACSTSNSYSNSYDSKFLVKLVAKAVVKVVVKAVVLVKLVKLVKLVVKAVVKAVVLVKLVKLVVKVLVKGAWPFESDAWGDMVDADADADIWLNYIKDCGDARGTWPFESDARRDMVNTDADADAGVWLIVRLLVKVLTVKISMSISILLPGGQGRLNRSPRGTWPVLKAI